MIAGQLFSSCINDQIGNYKVPEVQVSAGTANIGLLHIVLRGPGERTAGILLLPKVIRLIQNPCVCFQDKINV